MLEVRTDDRLPSLPAAFGNFLQISRLATEVQFEFLFVDINTIAVAIEKAKKSPEEESVKVLGTPVAKVVVPALSLMQVKEHIVQMFDVIEKEIGRLPDAKEAHHGSGRVIQT
jgi:hypothetical protein